MYNKFMISFDVINLFRNIPLKEVITLAVDLIKSNRQDVHLSKKDLITTLLNMPHSEPTFSFKGVMNDQIDGVAMRSPLAPILADYL